MVGGRPYCLSCLFTLSAVLLLTVSLPDVEASICSGIVHKKVGDTVEFSSCLPAEGVTLARWKQGDRLVADLYRNTEFRDRFYLNPTNFSLTVRKLTLQDSGQFSFVSVVDEKQRETVSITLQVHEPITEQPDLQVNSTWEALHGSCTVLLQCSSTSDRNVNYTLSVGNQTQTGSSLQFTLRPEDGETTITCTISDFISEMSKSKTVKCSNSTEPPGLNLVFVLSAAVGGSALFAIIVGIVVCVCCCRQKAAAGSDTNDLTVYADVAEVAPENRTTMKPCSVYETIENNVHPVTAVKPGPQTIYDQIQLNRVRKPSSPYQEI